MLFNDKVPHLGQRYNTMMAEYVFLSKSISLDTLHFHQEIAKYFENETIHIHSTTLFGQVKVRVLCSDVNCYFDA